MAFNDYSYDPSAFPTHTYYPHHQPSCLDTFTGEWPLPGDQQTPSLHRPPFADATNTGWQGTPQSIPLDFDEKLFGAYPLPHLPAPMHASPFPTVLPPQVLVAVREHYLPIAGSPTSLGVFPTEIASSPRLAPLPYPLTLQSTCYPSTVTISQTAPTPGTPIYSTTPSSPQPQTYTHPASTPSQDPRELLPPNQPEFQFIPYDPSSATKSTGTRSKKAAVARAPRKAATSAGTRAKATILSTTPAAPSRSPKIRACSGKYPQSKCKVKDCDAFLTGQTVWRHYTEHHEGRRVFCISPDCDASFTRNDSITRHIRTGACLRRWEKKSGR